MFRRIIAKFSKKSNKRAKIIRGFKADYSPSLYEEKGGIIYEKKGLFEREAVDRVRREQ